LHLRQKEDAMRFPVHFPGRLIGAAAIACAAALTPVAALAAASSFAAPATASAPRCTTYKLVIYLDVPLGNSYAGGDYYYIQFTNLSGHACTLRGYPGVSAVSLSGQQIGSPARWGSPSPTTVTLANGATAHANLQVADPADYGTPCAIGLPARPGRPATFPTAAGFRVYPPDQTASKVIPYPFAACARTGPVWMSAGAPWALSAVPANAGCGR
jgi:uncharacterized protein DUF4232